MTTDDVASEEMSAPVFQLTPRDVANIKESWMTVETRLIQVCPVRLDPSELKWNP